MNKLVFLGVFYGVIWGSIGVRLEFIQGSSGVHLGFIWVSLKVRCWFFRVLFGFNQG